MKKVEETSNLNEKKVARILSGGHANFEELAIAVINQGVQEEGRAYLSSPGGQWWLNTLNLEPEIFLEKYANLIKKIG